MKALSAMKHPGALCEHLRDFTRIIVTAVLVTLAILVNPIATRAEPFNNRGCAWPILMSPEGVANFQSPDKSARYWVMPFDTMQYEKMTIKGAFPDIRYFSFTAYETITMPDGQVVGFNLIEPNLYDAQIAPDQGSINPFVPPGGPGGTYTVAISRTGPSSGNTIAVSPNKLVWVLLRMYVANADPSQSGQSLMGGVPLPTIAVTDQTGASRQLDTCSPVNKWSDLSAFVEFLFPPAFDPKINEGTPSSDRLWFASPKNPPSILWPNPDGKYMMMWPGDNYQSGRIIVMHGKAPGFPDTFNGSSIWAPSRGFRNVDMRYWAMCNGNFASPISVVDCATDLTTRLEGGYYTIVISDDQQRPDWLSSNINWLPWGDEQYPKLVAFRNMLPAGNFHHAVKDAWASCAIDFDFSNVPDRSVLDAMGPCSQDHMGDYYPVAVWCDKATFIHGGWQACIKDALH